MITITVDGLDELIQRIGYSATLDLLEQPITRSVIHIEGRMKDYPPQRSGSNYRRTGVLGRRWSHEVSGGAGEIVGTVGNNTSYGPFVQSAAFQTRPHRGRWQTDEQVIEEEQNTIIGFFEDAVEDALDG